MAQSGLLNLEGAILDGISLNAHKTDMRAGTVSEMIQRDIRDAITSPYVLDTIIKELTAFKARMAGASGPPADLA